MFCPPLANRSQKTRHRAFWPLLVVADTALRVPVHGDLDEEAVGPALRISSDGGAAKGERRSSTEGESDRATQKPYPDRKGPLTARGGPLRLGRDRKRSGRSLV